MPSTTRAGQEDVLLEPAHEELLSRFADAHAASREPFYALRSSSGTLVQHPGLGDMNDQIFEEADLWTLHGEGLLRISENIRGGFSFVVTPRGLRHTQGMSRATASSANTELGRDIEAQRNLMIAVATGGPRIDSVSREYAERQARIRDGLAGLGIDDPNPYRDLWEWYGKWSADLPSYQSRRQYLTDLFAPLLDRVRHRRGGIRRHVYQPGGLVSIVV
jgi:hypothetical protein